MRISNFNASFIAKDAYGCSNFIITFLFATETVQLPSRAYQQHHRIYQSITIQNIEILDIIY